MYTYSSESSSSSINSNIMECRVFILKHNSCIATKTSAHDIFSFAVLQDAINITRIEVHLSDSVLKVCSSIYFVLKSNSNQYPVSLASFKAISSFETKSPPCIKLYHEILNVSMMNRQWRYDVMLCIMMLRPSVAMM